MKKLILTIAMAIVGAASFTACEKDGGEQVPPVQVLDLGDGSTAYELPEDMTLTYPNIYNLRGFVYVPSGRTLTIEAGVIIKGDKETKGTLVVERGAKIIAQGSAERPIVFTSAKAASQRKAGDWGGLIILGKAPNNKGEMTIEGGVRSKHGGTDPADNSGVLSYVRVEYAGIEYSPDNEINGITFGSVGNGTKVDHVQVSYSGDDAFEWFGGTVNATHLIALGTWDDDFDTDNGFSGNIQFAVALRDPKVADKSCSQGFESDNNAEAAIVEPTTRPIFANVSIFGPVTDPASFTDRGNEQGSAMGIFQTGVQVRRSSNCNLFNSLVAAFPIGLIIENDKNGNCQESATAGLLNMAGNVMAGCIKPFQDAALNPKDRSSVIKTSDAGTFVTAYWNTPALGNSAPLATLADLKLQGNPQSLTAPDFCPTAVSPLATGAQWTNAYVNKPFFVKTAYRGAFAPAETAANNWTSRWASFTPATNNY